MGERGGLDLHLPVSGTRPARALEDALRGAVVDGRLASGTRLPSARSLARDLGVARNTVADVYARLAAEGWLRTQVGAGTWVVGRARPQVPAVVPRVEGAVLDLRGGLADASDFPAAAWAAATRRALAQTPSTAFGYAPPAGDLQLRESLIRYLARTRGVTATGGELVAGQGFTDVLSSVGRALHARGARRVGVEAYGHRAHRQVLVDAGLELVALPVDGHGAVVDAVHGLDVDAVLLTPSHQFPTGVALRADRRRAVVEWAAARGGFVIEDDYDGEFRYDRRSIGSLQALAPDRVVYAGTASKALAPSVGLAWAVVPGDLLPDVLAQRELTARPSGLHQRTFAAFVDEHDYDRAIRRRRAAFRQRRALLVELLAHRAPRSSPWGLPAGLQCLVTLPSAAAEERAVAEAERRGVRIEGLSSFAVDGAHGREPADAHAGPGPGVVVGYGAPPPAQAGRALQLVVDAIAVATDAR